jgi:polygalacturonase
MSRILVSRFIPALVFTATIFAAPADTSAPRVDVSRVENLRPELPRIPEAKFNLLDFHAVDDGHTLNTDAFVHAIEAVRKAGGGHLIVPRGTFVTAPVELCSNLDLHLEDGAVIQAPSTFAELGLPDPAQFKTQDELTAAFKTPPPLIHAEHVHDLSITGTGVIDGAGAHWWAWSERAARHSPGRLQVRRPHLVVIRRAERVYVANVTLRNSSMFHLVPGEITDLTIERVKVRAPFDAPNTDAIDPGPGTNFLIRNCDIDTGDDDIVIKSGGTNILIEDCTIKHGHGISIGSGTTLGISNMLVRRCTFDGADNGIRIKSMRGAGGPVRNIRYTEITMKNMRDAIVLDLNYLDNNRADFKGPWAKIPSIANILIDHVTVESSINLGRIVGLPESKIERVVFEDCTFAARTGLVVKDAGPITEKNVKITIDPHQPNAWQHYDE